MTLNRITHAVAVVLCATVPALVFAVEKGNVYDIKYDGGSIADAKAGVDMKLYMDPDKIRIIKDKKEVIVIPAASVTELS